MSNKYENFADMPISEKLDIINDILEKHILKSLSDHGGGLELVDIKGWQIIISYRGACQSCPMANAGTLDYIESVFQGMINKNIEVISI